MIHRIPDNVKPCPICGKKDQLYLWTDENLGYPHISCIRCEIDTWTATSTVHVINRWNKLPRKEQKK